MILAKLWLRGFHNRSASLWASFAKLDMMAPWRHKTRKCLDQNPSFFRESFDRTPWRFWVSWRWPQWKHGQFPTCFRMSAEQFGKLLQMLCLTLEDRTATSPTDQRYFAICCLQDLFFLFLFFFTICLLFVTQRCALRDTDNELVYHCCWCCFCWGYVTSTIMGGWCVCLRCESSEKSTIRKIKGLRDSGWRFRA